MKSIWQCANKKVVSHTNKKEAVLVKTTPTRSHLKTWSVGCTGTLGSSPLSVLVVSRREGSFFSFAMKESVLVFPNTKIPSVSFEALVHRQADTSLHALGQVYSRFVHL